MMMTGIMGLYVGRIYSEVKGRPLYVIDKSVGFEAEAGADSRKPLSEARKLKARA
jgi:dolichol-phosphate mannosyltransferase